MRREYGQIRRRRFRLILRGARLNTLSRRGRLLSKWITGGATIGYRLKGRAGGFSVSLDTCLRWGSRDDGCRRAMVFPACCKGPEYRTRPGAALGGSNFAPGGSDAVLGRLDSAEGSADLAEGKLDLAKGGADSAEGKSDLAEGGTDSDEGGGDLAEGRLDSAAGSGTPLLKNSSSYLPSFAWISGPSFSALPEAECRCGV